METLGTGDSASHVAKCLLANYIYTRVRLRLNERLHHIEGSSFECTFSGDRDCLRIK